MKISRIRGSLVGMMVSLFFVGQAIAREDASWLVRQRNASPNGQWVLRQDGAVNLLPRPSREVPKRTEDVAKRDDRKDLEGNRGRPIGDEEKEKPKEKGKTFQYTHFVFVDSDTINAWEYDRLRARGAMGVNPLSLASLKYNAAEIAFLKTQTFDQLYAAIKNGGFISMPVAETPLASSRDLKLSRVLDYVVSKDVNLFRPGEKVHYDVSLTNPYDKPLTLSVAVAITSNAGTVWKYDPTANPDAKDSRGKPVQVREYTNGKPIVGDSTKVWKEVTLQPGQTVVLQNVYDSATAGEKYPMSSWYQNLRYTGFYFDVTIKDSKSGQSFNKPVAGYFLEL